MVPRPMSYIEEEDRRCRHCHSHKLQIDWGQGDRVCTDCGVVDDERLLDDRPEWRDFNDAEDIIKGAPSGARSGMVVVDETKYLGGLQPTGLSKRAFGPPLQSTAVICKKLNATNRKLDNMMEKEHKRALKRARLSRNIRKKQMAIEESDDNIRPEYDQLVVQEEEEDERARSAVQEEEERLYAILHTEKWSLERATLLCGSENEQPTHVLDLETEREELLSRLDSKLKRASSDLYMAYTILQQAAHRLKLPPRVIHHATDTLCKFASCKDGLTVKGVASRLSKESTVTVDPAVTERLRDYNKQKQMAALASALLFLDARKDGHQRSLKEVCASFHGPTASTEPFVKAKHCSKAINELREIFPDYMRVVSAEHFDDSVSFVEHATRKLNLPPVATASIQALVQHLVGEDGRTMSKVCASVTLLITMAGTVMQRLANQAVPYQASPKRQKKDSGNERAGSINSTPFSIFSHPVISEEDDPSHKSYEMRQMWDAWSEQMPWARSVADIEQSCKVSRSVILDHFKTMIYPQRTELLSKLRDVASDSSTSSKLRSTPRAMVLLSEIHSASSLLDSQGKV